MSLMSRESMVPTWPHLYSGSHTPVDTQRIVRGMRVVSVARSVMMDVRKVVVSNNMLVNRRCLLGVVGYGMDSVMIPILSGSGCLYLMVRVVASVFLADWYRGQWSRICATSSTSLAERQGGCVQYGGIFLSSALEGNLLRLGWLLIRLCLSLALVVICGSSMWYR